MSNLPILAILKQRVVASSVQTGKILPRKEILAELGRIKVHVSDRSVVCPPSDVQNPDVFPLIEEKMRSEGLNGNAVFFYATWSTKKKELRDGLGRLVSFDEVIHTVVPVPILYVFISIFNSVRPEMMWSLFFT